MKLNLGCGRKPKQGWTNLDRVALPGVDVVHDVTEHPLPFEANSCTELRMAHLLEHITDPLSLMQELWRIAVPGGKLTVRVPYGSSDDAWLDLTHVRPYFRGSWGFFSQPFYWRADYGYRGDWQPDTVALYVSKRHREVAPSEMLKRIDIERNLVYEMVVTLNAVKPIRPPQVELQSQPMYVVRLWSGHE